MNILADENIALQIVERLRKDGLGIHIIDTPPLED